MSTAFRTSAPWAIAATAVLLSGCSGDKPAIAPTAAASVTIAAASTAASPSVSKGTPDLSAPETVATGLDVPWGLAFLPDGSALVAERGAGRVLRVAPGGGAPRPVLTMPGVATAGEGGLLGLAVAGDYARTGWVYAYYTAADDNRIARFKIGGGDPEVIFDGISRAGIHNGGRIAFGPDGMLYVGTGDAGERDAAQDAGDSNGKILRLTPEGRPAPGNPTPGSPVWSLGHRNVQGLAWAADGTMYGIEFGQNTFDEVNVIKPGHNYGWPKVEGKGGVAGFTDPIVTWGTDVASPSGAAIAGDNLYVAALRGQRLWIVPLGGGEPRAEFSGRYGRLRTVAVAPDGALWLTTSNRDGHDDPRDGDDRILRFPAR